MAYKILLVDDHLVVRTGIVIVLKKEIENLKIFNAENFLETISILKENSFDLVILDINIPGTKKTDMIQDIRLIRPNIKILIFSAHEEDQYAFRYIISGANGYLSKLSSEKKIVQVVLTILENGKYITDEVMNKIIDSAFNKIPLNPIDKLSKREFEIAGLLVEGLGNLEISNTLKIQMSTVSTYKTRVFEKLKIKNIVALIDVFKTNMN
jgi:DNA-binding NarL/FixJ family response regulator